MPHPHLLSREDLNSRGIHYSRAHFGEKSKTAHFRGRSGWENRIAWLSTEIDKWIEAIAAARNRRLRERCPSKMERPQLWARGVPELDLLSSTSIGKLIQHPRHKPIR